MRVSHLLITLPAAMTLILAAAVDAQSITPTYDALNRLTAVQVPTGTATMTQDAAGNVLSLGFVAGTTPINGQCGAASGVATVVRPSAFLCSAGTSIAAPSGSGPWTWTCSGINGGTNATGCMAPTPATPTCIAINQIGPVAQNASATLTATCVNAPSLVWQVNGVRIAACDNLTSCSVTFTTAGANIVSVTPTGGTGVAISVTVTPPASCATISASGVAIVGVTTVYTAACTGTSTIVWKLNGTQVAACNDQVTCALSIASVGANTLTAAPSATSAAGVTATLNMNVVAPSASCSEITGSTVAPAAGATQSYSATCSNAAGYVWMLGSTTLACTTATCAVSIPANTAPTQNLRALSVGPSTATGASASLTIMQAPAAVAPLCGSSVAGQTAYTYAGGASTYSVVCAGATSLSWVLAGVTQSCASSNCLVVVPANTGAASINLPLVVTANNLNGSTVVPSLSISVAGAPACSLDFNGDGSVNTTDALIFGRWLLGFRGDALVSGITPYPAGTTTSAFASAVTARMLITSVHDIDNNTAIDAATDGLLFLRLTLGMRDGALVNGSLGQGATRVTYDSIRTHLNNNCATSYPQ